MGARNGGGVGVRWLRTGLVGILLVGWGATSAALTSSAVSQSFPIGMTPPSAGGPPAVHGGGTQAIRSASMFRGDPLHRGVYDTRGVDTLGTVAWRFETGGAVRSSATIYDGTLYVGSSDHHLYALDAASGGEIWRFNAGAAVSSSPAVDQERVVFVDRAGDIHALARDSGSPLWKVATGAERDLPWGNEGWDYFTASPTLIGDRVLIGSGDGHLYALDASRGSELWRFDAGTRIRTTPAVVEGLVLFGDSDGVFHALDIDGGSSVWRFETAGHSLTSADVGFDRRQIYSSAAVHEGVVYFGSRDAQLYALDLRDGRELWRVDDGSSAWVISSPAVTGDRVYSARSSSTKVRALNATDGSEIWSITTGGGVFSSPVLVGDTLYVGNASGWVMALAAADGSERWRYRTGGGVWATPLVANGRLYVGSDDGFLYALESTDGAPPKRAVYWQEEGVAISSMGMGPPQRRILSYFEYYGYELLSADTLPGFLQARIDDGAPSVVVFAMDHLPEAVASEPLEGALYRRYLGAGGKIVWMGAPPSFYVVDEDSGQVTGVDLERPGEILGVDTAGYRTDLYPIVPTADGRRWGLRDPWVGMGGFAADDVDVVLAVDELGRVMSWARTFGGPEGSGLVFVRPAYDAAALDEVRAVAEYGVLRTPPPGQ